MILTAIELAERLGGTLTGDGSVEVRALESLFAARPGDAAFFKDAKYAAQLAATKASVVLVSETWQGTCPAPAVIRVPDPDGAFARAAVWFEPSPPERAPGIHPTALIGRDVHLGASVHVGPYTVIEDGCVIGDGCVIEAQVFLGRQVSMGEGCHIYPQVTVREGCILGCRVVLHSGVRIGGDGYGYTPKVAADGTVTIDKIPQLGIVELGDDVEVGCNATIDRARFGRTRIGNSTKIDNLVQIGHNVQVGSCSGIIAQAGVAGSTRIGSGCLIWAQAGISGHLEIGDRGQVGPKSGLAKDVPAGEYVLGLPAIPRREFAASLLVPRQIEKLKRQLAEIQAELAALKS